MAKRRLYICNGEHRIARRQMHPPRGWELRRISRQRIEAVVWFCAKCIETGEWVSALEKDR